MSSMLETLAILERANNYTITYSRYREIYSVADLDHNLVASYIPKKNNWTYSLSEVNWSLDDPLGIDLEALDKLIEFTRSLES